jgi:nitrogen fixation/metabolism regulation signal transduction histidine kinase
VAWGEVARRLAHEIKNPLTPIQLSAERLSMKLAHKLDAPDAQLLERATTTIVNQVTSLKHMVDDFREYARKPPLAMEEVDLNDLVGDVLTLYGWNSAGDGSRETGHPWQLDVSFEPGLPHILGDPTQLRQVIHNLLANARDALGEAGDGGVIHVTTRETSSSGGDAQENAAVRLTVSDNGPGFALQVLQRAFEPYVTTKTHGTGLGLAIVRKIIEEHDARIDLSNSREGGARVSILFTRLAVQVDGEPQDNDNAVVN